MSIGNGPNPTGGLFVTPIECSACAMGGAPSDPYVVHDGAPLTDLQSNSLDATANVPLSSSTATISPASDI